MPELSLIEQFRQKAPTHPWLIVGPGQDCAIVRWGADRDVAYKIDQVQEGTHFVLSGPGAAVPSRVGWKAVAKACSDIAATGFWPVAATVAVNLRQGTDERIAMELYEGISACCNHYGFALAGGDLATSPNGLSVVTSLLGEGPRGGAWLRRGAKPGDVLLVTGTLGGSRAHKHLHFMPRLPEAREIRRIVPDGVHACIDITDGLSRDLKHICDESQCGAVLFEDKIPVSDETLQFATGKNGRAPVDQALEDGEDFELLLAVDPAAAELLLKEWKQTVPLAKIGEIRPASEGRSLRRQDNSTRPLPDVGYEHRT
jgi:thiamine-monophosphate kinase